MGDLKRGRSAVRVTYALARRPSSAACIFPSIMHREACNEVQCCMCGKKKYIIYMMKTCSRVLLKDLHSRKKERGLSTPTTHHTFVFFEIVYVLAWKRYTFHCLTCLSTVTDNCTQEVGVASFWLLTVNSQLLTGGEDAYAIQRIPAESRFRTGQSFELDYL